MTYRIPSYSLQRSLSLKNEVADCHVEEVADGLVMLYVVVEVSPRRIDNAAWQLIEGVHRLASYLDTYENMTFQAFCLQLSAAWQMVQMQKQKDRKTPTR